jgi:hypothetical protein
MKIVAVLLIGLVVLLGIASILYLFGFVLVSLRSDGKMVRADMRKLSVAERRLTWAAVAVWLGGTVVGCVVGLIWLRPGPTQSDSFAGEFKGAGIGMSIALPITFGLMLWSVRLSRDRLAKQPPADRALRTP